MMEIRLLNMSMQTLHYLLLLTQGNHLSKKSGCVRREFCSSQLINRKSGNYQEILSQKTVHCSC